MTIIRVNENPQPARTANGAMEKLRKMMMEAQAMEKAGAKKKETPKPKHWDNRIGDFVD